MLCIILLLLGLIVQTILGLGVEVEDVTGKQLEAALQTEELLAVMFCKYPTSLKCIFRNFPSIKNSKIGSECCDFNCKHT